MTGAVDFAGRRPSEDRMPVEGADFDKLLALRPLKDVDIPAEQAEVPGDQKLFEIVLDVDMKAPKFHCPTQWFLSYMKKAPAPQNLPSPQIKWG